MGFELDLDLETLVDNKQEEQNDTPNESSNELSLDGLLDDSTTTESNTESEQESVNNKPTDVTFDSSELEKAMDEQVESTTESTSTTLSVVDNENNIVINLEQLKDHNIPYLIAKTSHITDLCKLFVNSGAKFAIADKVYVDIPHLICGDYDKLDVESFMPNNVALTFVLPHILSMLTDIIDSDYVFIIGSSKTHSVELGLDNALNIVPIPEDDFAIRAANYVYPVVNYNAEDNSITVNLENVIRLGVGYYDHDVQPINSEIHDILKAREWEKYPELNDKERFETLLYTNVKDNNGYKSIIRLSDQLKSSSVFITKNKIHLFESTSVYVARKLSNVYIHSNLVDILEQIQKEYLTVVVPDTIQSKVDNVKQFCLPLNVLRTINIKLTELEDLWLIHDKETDEVIFAVGYTQTIEDDAVSYICAILRL